MSIEKVKAYLEQFGRAKDVLEFETLQKHLLFNLVIAVY